MNLPFVIPGHYESNETLNSETKKIIRVLGEGDKKDCFKVQNEKREFHENEILNAYTYMPTSSHEFTNEVEFGEFKDEEENLIEEIQEFAVENKTVTFEQLPQHNQNNFQPNIVQHKPVKSEDDIFVENLLTKIINENQSIIAIPINFSFKYDIEKLKNLINILDVDKKTINLIIEKLIDEDLKQNLFSALKNTILNIINNNIVNEPAKNIIQNEIVVENKKETIDLTKLDKKNFTDVNNLFDSNLLNNKYL